MSDFEIDVSFVADDRLRRLVEDFHHQAQAAYEAGAYLGTLVACGAILEGLLSWALSERKEQAVKSSAAQKDKQGQVLPIERWYLSNLIAVAVQIDLLGPTAKDASWAVKDFRNLIHPHILLKQSARPDQALALGALAAVTEISRSLQGRLST